MLKTILALSLSLGFLQAQTAVFPRRVVTDADTGVAANRIDTQLSVPISSSATSITVADASRIVPNLILTIGTSRPEYVWVCAVNGATLTLGRASCPNTDGRGVDGSTAISHAAHEAVKGYINAWNFNSLRVELQAIEASAGFAGVQSSQYNFSPRYPAESLIAGGIGQYVTVNCPEGLKGSDTNHFLRLSGGTGTAETVQVLGGTCAAAGTTGTLVISVPAYNHAGAYSVTSATAGIQEAVNANPGGRIGVPSGTWETYAATYITSGVNIEGASRSGTIIHANSTTQDVFHIDTPNPVRIAHLTIFANGIVPASGAGVHITDVAGDSRLENSNSVFEDLTVGYMYNDFYFDVAGSWSIRDCYIINPVQNGVVVRNSVTPDAGDSNVSNSVFDANMGAGYGNGAAILQVSSGGLRIQNNKFNRYNYSYHAQIETIAQTSVLVIDGNSMENAMMGGIVMERVGTGTFSNIIISNNEVTPGLGDAINLGKAIDSALIAANVLTPVNGVGVKLGGTNYSVTSNLVTGVGTSTGIDFAGIKPPPAPPDPAQNTYAASNTYIGVATPYVADAGGNGNVIDDLVAQMPTIASTTTVTVGAFSTYKVTGTAVLQNINGGVPGRTCRFIFTDAAPGGVGSSGNIARAQAAVQNQSISLTWDGSAWF